MTETDSRPDPGSPSDPMIDPNRYREEAAARRSRFEPPPGQRDVSDARITYHALMRFVERYRVPLDRAERELRGCLRRTRRLGSNPRNGATASLAVHRGRALVAVLQGEACVTVLTWNQFLPRLGDFGRVKLPRNRGRWLRRLSEPIDGQGSEPEECDCPDPR